MFSNVKKAIWETLLMYPISTKYSVAATLKSVSEWKIHLFQFQEYKNEFE